VHVDAARLAVVDLAAHHRGVGVRLHLEARDAVPVDVAALKVALVGGRSVLDVDHNTADILCHEGAAVAQEARAVVWQPEKVPGSIPGLYLAKCRGVPEQDAT